MPFPDSQPGRIATLAAVRRNGVKGLLFLAFWTGIGLSFASQHYLSLSKAGRPVTWAQAVGYSLGDWYVFAALSIPIAALARRYPFERRRWGQALLVHLLSSVLFSLAWVLLRAWVGQWQNSLAGSRVPFAESFNFLLRKSFTYNLWIGWVIVVVVHAFEYHEKFHERALRASELEKSLATAKLHALQMQMNPHFLFNTLHTISALMHRDVSAADRMIARLSELLRLALDNTHSHEVPLSEEVRFLQRYLEIEQTRFGPRLAVTMNFSPESLDAHVPNLILQPLVENSIRHGIERHSRPGRIELGGERQGSRLRLFVRDNGGGLKDQMREAEGLSNTRQRLEQLYGTDQSFTIINTAEAGVLATVEIPFHSAAPAGNPLSSDGKRGDGVQTNEQRKLAAAR